MMNIIRTPAVELSSIPAIAYKQKIGSGGSGLRILRLDRDAVAVFTLNKRTAAPVAFGQVDASLFPAAAVDEAMELTDGLPYSARGKIKVSVFEEKQDEQDVTEEETEAVDMVDSEEYAAIVARYSDETGKINYKLLNKDFIQFAAKSKVVADLIAAQADEEVIVAHIVKNRAAYLAGKKDSLSDQETAALLETLDEIAPRSALKELKSHIRRMSVR